MSFVYEAIPDAKRGELEIFAPFAAKPEHWVVDAERRAFMVEAGLKPPPAASTLFNEYPVRFFLCVEGKAVVFDLFRNRLPREKNSLGDIGGMSHREI